MPRASKAAPRGKAAGNFSQRARVTAKAFFSMVGGSRDMRWVALAIEGTLNVYTYLRPADAREVAAMLTAAADEVERDAESK